MKQLLKKYNTFLWSSISLLILSFTIYLASRYVTQEQNIYCWDWNGYFRMWQRISLAFSTQPIGAMTTVLNSIKNDDYNALPVALISLPPFSGSGSRWDYIISLSIFYLFPAILFFSLLCKRFSTHQSTSALLLSLILPATFAPFWEPTLRGLPDVSGLLCLIGAILYASSRDFSIKIDIRRAIGMGILLWSAFLLRRWYAYTIVSLYLSLPVLNYFIYNAHVFPVERAIRIAANFAIALASSFLLACIFQGGLVDRIIHTNYSDLYSAYQSGFLQSLCASAQNMGLYLIPFLALGFAWSFFWKNTLEKYIILFSCFNLLLSFYLFTRTQSPVLHHNLPFSLWVLIVVVFTIKELTTRINNRKMQAALTGAISCICLFILNASLFDSNGSNRTRYLNAFLPLKVPPLRIDNYDNYARLSIDIGKMATPENKVTVLASSGILNEDMLNSISNLKINSSLSSTAHVDRRDRINFQSLVSRYVIVSDPVQTHLPLGTQQVITIPAGEILNCINIGKAFSRVGTGYALANGTTAYVYEKIRPYTLNEVKLFLAKYYRDYPEWEDQYSKGFYIPYLASEVKVGTHGGEFAITDGGEIIAQPGDSSPTSVMWHLSGIEEITITSISRNATEPAVDGIDVTISDLGGNEMVTHIDNGKSVVVNVSKYNGAMSALVIDKHGTPYYDRVLIKVSKYTR